MAQLAGKRTKSSSSSMNLEIPLPELAIQHIQSLLLTKEAAQTSILSKSWYWAWLTRPDLEFISFEFPTIDAFCESIEKAIESHEQLNLKIQSFRIYGNLGNSTQLLADYELIQRAIRMDPVMFAIELDHLSDNYVLPGDILSSETLIRLSLERCTVKRGAMFNRQVRCSKLQSLSLRRTKIDARVLWDLFSVCTSIEDMFLSDCSCFFIFVVYIYPIENQLQQTINQFEFKKLRCLVLEEMRLLPSFFENFSTNFPCLKDFSVHYCDVEEEIRICSPSLERVTFIPMGSGVAFRATFDVPNLLKFTFSGLLPVLSFENLASREWESDISISCCRYALPKWFLELKRFLTNFRLSRISLSINLWSHVENVRHRSNAESIQGLSELVMFEDMRVQQHLSMCPTSLDCLFLICQPKFIGYYWIPASLDGRYGNYDYLKILCEKLVGVGENCSDPIQDLVEVNVNRFEKIRAEWQPMSMATLLDDLTIMGTKEKIRFHLKWK